jgi:uncharacterized protein (TIGR03437 family)
MTKCGALCLIGALVFSGAASGDSLSFTFTDLNIPGGGNASGINDRGQVVGNSFATNPSTGFLDTGGSFSSVYFSGSQYTSPAGIDNSGQIVGSYYNGVFNGFLETKGSFAPLNYPGAFLTFASGINNLGQIVGYFNNTSAGFLYSNGTFSVIAVPGATHTSAAGINDSGQIVGQYVDSQGVSHGFLDNNGTFTTIDVPGALGTGVLGINNQGRMVGSYSSGNGCMLGFVDTLGVLTAGIGFPGAQETYLNGINNSGQIVGSASAAGLELGFVATPSPATTIPQINACGIVNGASYTAPVAPGSIAAVFGDFFLGSTSVDTDLPLDTSLQNLSFQFSGGTQAPLYFVSDGQVNLQVPWELAGKSAATLTATLSGKTGASQTVSLAAFAPAIFTTNAQGTGQGAILDQNFHLVDSSNPATAGTTYLLIYCTGLGAVTNQPATGSPALSNPLSWTTTTPTVTIGGVLSTNVSFHGLAPGYAGLYQVNALVPPGVAAGNAVPVAVSIGAAASNAVTIAVQ